MYAGANKMAEMYRASGRVAEMYAGANRMAEMYRASSRVAEMYAGAKKMAEMSKASGRMADLFDAEHRFAGARILGRQSVLANSVDLSAVARTEVDIEQVFARQGQKVDVSGILDPSASRSDLARSVDQIFESVNSLAKRSEPNQLVVDEDSDTEPESCPVVPRSLLWSPSESVVWVPTQERRGGRGTFEELEPVTVFCGNAYEDERYRDALVKHLWALRAAGDIRVWHRGDVAAGEDWQNAIWKNLELARLALLLISADYLHDLYESGMYRRVEAHVNAKRATVVPVFVRPVDVRGTFIEKLAPLPSNQTAITMWTNPDEAWLDVARGVRSAVDAIRKTTSDART
jgi:hypothetical protein